MNPGKLREWFHGNFTERGELGAACAVAGPGGVTFSLEHGWRDRARKAPWTPDTLVLVWSATKGPAAACLLHLMEQCGATPETKVASFWPEFAQNGKEALTLGDILSHQAGLMALDPPRPAITDRAAVVDALARQTPALSPGHGHGYHPRTYGFLIDELIRRLSARQGRELTLGAYWRRTFAEPLGLGFWIGLPDKWHDRVAQMQAPAVTGVMETDPLYQALQRGEGLAFDAFASPSGLHRVSEMNAPEVRRMELGSFGGIGTAQALALFYALLAGDGSWEGKRFFEPATLEWMRLTRVRGDDAVLLRPTAFSCGFMKDPVDAQGKKQRALFGPSPMAFGQPGAGGAHAFADPESGLGFAYVMNQMTLGVLPNEKSLGLVRALYDQ